MEKRRESEKHVMKDRKRVEEFKKERKRGEEGRR